MKILITGGSSHIATQLGNYLEKKHSVHFLTRKKKLLKKKNYHFYNNQFNSINKLYKKYKFDLTIHLATYSKRICSAKDFKQMNNANILFGNFLLEAINKYSVKKNFIYTMTFWQYGDNNSDLPNTLYAAYKASFKKIIDYYHYKKNINCINLVLYDIFSPSDNRSKIFNTIENNFKNKKKTVLTKLNQKISLIHINDLLSAFSFSIKIFNKNIKINNIYHVRGKILKLKKIIDVFLKIKKISSKYIIIGKKKTSDYQIINPCNKGFLIPNWKPKYDINNMFK